MEDEMKNELESLRQINAMMYLKPTQPSLISKRQTKVQPFATQVSQPGEVSQVIFNSGGDMVWGPTSVIKLNYDIQSVGVSDMGAFFGVNGSILNAFKSVRLTHRSGEQLEYVDQAGLFAAVKAIYNYDDSRNLKLEGLLNNRGIGQPLAAGVPVNITSMIPLSLFLGVFDTQECIPAQLLSGAKLEIQWHVLNNIVALAANASTFIRNFKATLLLDTLAPYDAVVREINSQASDTNANGIQYTYETCFASNQVFLSSAINFDVQNSVSICSKVAGIMRKTADINGGVALKVPMAMYGSLDQAQYRLGSEYYPNIPQDLTGNGGFNQTEAYKDTLIAFKSYPDQFGPMNYEGSAVTIAEFAPGSASVGQAVYAMTLDRSPTMYAGKYSGSATNNSRLLNLAYTNNAGAVAAGITTLQTYTLSLRVANLAADTCILDR